MFLLFEVTEFVVIYYISLWKLIRVVKGRNNSKSGPGLGPFVELGLRSVGQHPRRANHGAEFWRGDHTVRALHQGAC